MLLSFRVANHRSLRTEQQLLLTPGDSPDGSLDAGCEAVPVAGVFGPNASGKSNVIDALIYMRDMVQRSLRESEPDAGIRRHPFALDAVAREEPSTYVVDLLLEGVQYTYGLSVDDTQVVEEWMYSYPERRKYTIFHRKLDVYTYGEHVPPSMFQVGEITASNVLYLSVAARSKQKHVRPVYDWFARVLDRGPMALRNADHDPIAEALDRMGYLEQLTRLLKAADTGIESAELVEETQAELVRRFPSGKFPDGRKVPSNKYLIFKHRGQDGTFVLRLQDQSLGTKTLYVTCFPVFLALEKGYTLLLDELDSSLHPYLSAQLIRLFADPSTNPRGAQLIFTSHDATLLGRIQGEEVLRRDHIWFIEKNEYGVTELFPLSDFEPRKDEKRERNYLAGRYGAVPVVNDELFAAALSTRGEGDDGVSGAQAEEAQH